MSQKKSKRQQSKRKVRNNKQKAYTCSSIHEAEKQGVLEEYIDYHLSIHEQHGIIEFEGGKIHVETAERAKESSDTEDSSDSRTT